MGKRAELVIMRAMIVKTLLLEESDSWMAETKAKELQGQYNNALADQLEYGEAFIVGVRIIPEVEVLRVPEFKEPETEEAKRLTGKYCAEGDCMATPVEGSIFCEDHLGV